MSDESSPKPVWWLVRALEELGLVSIYKSPIDTKLLCLQRFVRLFAYGASTLVLVSYLSALGHPEDKIGLFMTLTLVGDVAISFCLTLVADGLGRRAILALGAALMTASGVVFALSDNYWVLLAAAIFGVISPSGNEIGPFRAIEESTLAHLTPAAVRSDIFAWYSLLGTAGAAFGIMACGWIVHRLHEINAWDYIRAYRLIFYLYAVIGVIKFALACALSRKVEAEKKTTASQDMETTPLLADGNMDEPKTKGRFASLFPTVSKESRAIVVNLCILFALDAFASGLVPLSWIVYFFKQKFTLQEGVLGSLFFTTSIIAALSMLVASSLAKRIGNVKAMVFTHLPSTIALALIPFPSNKYFAMLFLILRHCTASMDVAPRSAFLAAVILPNERTAIMGTLNVVKTSAQSLGPAITGVLAAKKLFWIAFVMAGALKAIYDLGMLAIFAGHKTREEQATQQSTEEEEEGGETD